MAYGNTCVTIINLYEEKLLLVLSTVSMEKTSPSDEGARSQVPIS